MRRYAAILVLVAFTLPACAGQRPVTIVTPQGKTAFTSNEVLKRVQEVQNAAISAEAAKGIPTDVARIIIAFTVESAKVLGATPQGWGATVASLWASAKAQIPLAWLVNPYIQVAVAALDAALATFLPVGGVA
jgi:hypothetical protein